MLVIRRGHASNNRRGHASNREPVVMLVANRCQVMT